MAIVCYIMFIIVSFEASPKDIKHMYLLIYPQMLLLLLPQTAIPTQN